MKYLFSLLLVLFVIQLKAQNLPLDSETQKITFSEVVEVKGATRAVLGTRAKQWATAAKCTTKVDKKAEGKYGATGSIKVKYPAPMKGFFHEGVVKYKVSVFSKEGKYKYEFTDFVHHSDRANGGALEKEIPECGKFTLVPAGWSAIKKQVSDEMPKIIESLKSAMEKKGPAPKKNDMDF